MEINHVIVAGVNKGIVPQARVMNSATDETSKRRRMEAERSLLLCSQSTYLSPDNPLWEPQPIYS